MTVDRQKFILRAVLSYALSNVADINDALGYWPHDAEVDSDPKIIKVGEEKGKPLTEAEVQEIVDQL